MLRPERKVPKGVTSQAGNSAPSFPQVAITGVGLCCVAGDQSFALFGAVGTNLSAARLDPLQPGGGGTAPALIAPVMELEGVDHPAERIQLLAESALAGALGSLREEPGERRLLLALLLPGETTSRGENLDRAGLSEILCSLHPALEKAEIRFLSPESGGVQPLAALCRELADGEWDAVLFGGADSFVDPVTCHELAYRGRLLAEGETEGIAPGEAGAFLLLEPAEKISAGTRVWARIAGAAQHSEPYAGQGAEKKTAALTQAMEDAAEQAGFKAAEMKEFVLTLSAEKASHLEWHQTAMKLWPPRPPENEWDEPEMPEVLRLHYVLGDVGAAALPVALVLGCARFEFEHPLLESLLICDGGDVPVRGAVCLASKKER